MPISPATELFGYNSLKDLAGGVAGLMNMIGDNFYTGFISGKYAMNDPLNISKEIVKHVVNVNPTKNITFRVLHSYSGLREAYGFVYPGGTYGVVTIRPTDGNIITYLINNGEYTERFENFGYNSLAELSAGVAGQMKIGSFDAIGTLDQRTYTFNVYISSVYIGRDVLGQYIIAQPNGTVLCESFVRSVNSEGYISFGFEDGLPIGTKYFFKLAAC